MRSIVVVASFVALTAAPVAAGPITLTTLTFTFNTQDSPFTPGVDNQGWWSTTRTRTVSPNYFTGYASGDLLRSFFTFDLSSLNLAGQKITSATLSLPGFDYASPDASETLGLFDVSTPASTLNRNTGTSVPIFTDLGTGTSYGTFVVPSYPSNQQTLPFVLNDAGVADITKAAGGFFSIGGSLLSIDHFGSDIFEALFSSSFGRGDQALTVTTEPDIMTPEPASLLLVASGMVVMVRRVRRSQRSKGPSAD